MESEQADCSWVVGEGVERDERKRTHGHGEQCGDCGGEDIGGGEEGKRGINSNGKIQ